MSLTSGFRTILIDRQPPYRVAQAWHRLARAVGFPETTVTARGFPFRVRRLTCDVNFVHNVVVDEEYFPPEITVRSTDVIVDVGGNIGTFAVMASAKVPGGRVYTIEPDPENLRLLRANLAQNPHTAKTVTVLPYAIAATSGPIDFFTANEGGYHSILPGRVEGGTVRRADAITLEQLFDDAGIERCHLLKLDCEGAEYDILRTIPAQVRGRIDQIAMEYHRVPDAEAHLRACLYRLGPGFTVVRHDAFEGGGGHMFLRRVEMQ